MAKVATVPVSLTRVQQEGVKLLTPLEQDVKALRVTTAEEYEAADMLLSDIGRARRQWRLKIDPILSPLKQAIDKAKEAMMGAKALDAEVDGPFTLLEERVKKVMRDYKLEERRQLQAAKDAQDAAIEQDRLKLVELTRKEELAKTAALRMRLGLQRSIVEAHAQELESTPKEAPVKAASSQARNVRKWRVTDVAAVLAGILEGSIPDDVMVVDSAAVGRHYRDSAETVESWPGFEGFDDVVIARRG